MLDRNLANRIVDLMNELLSLDPHAISALVAARVPCNDALIEHPTVQAGPIRECEAENYVGIIGVLNGLVGVTSQGAGLIAVIVEADGSVTSFTVLDRE